MKKFTRYTRDTEHEFTLLFKVMKDINNFLLYILKLTTIVSLSFHTHNL